MQSLTKAPSLQCPELLTPQEFEVVITLNHEYLTYIYTLLSPIDTQVDQCNSLEDFTLLREPRFPEKKSVL